MVLACRLLPLELLVPLIARTPLLDLGLRSAYSDPQPLDPELRRLVARPALRPRAAKALRAMSIGMALRPRAATAAPLTSVTLAAVSSLLTMRVPTRKRGIKRASAAWC